MKRAGVNTNKQMFDYVFSKTVQEKIAELVEIDYDAVPTTSEESAIAAAVDGAEVILSTWGGIPYSQTIMDRCPDLKLVLYGAGSFKSYVTEALLQTDPTVCTSVHLNAIPTAEYSLTLILISLKNAFPLYDAIQKKQNKGWDSGRFGFSGGYYRTTVGILGYGMISRHLMSLLSNFDMNVLIADDFVTAEAAREHGARKCDVDYLMANSDVVTIHHADIERNWNLVNKRTLALMKPGARIINTSRGRMINEDALVDKLKTGEITAYLDVTHPEPPEPGHPFYKLPNCIMTPHIAGAIGGEVERFGEFCLRELTAWIEGRPYENPVDIRSLSGRA